MSGWFWLCKVDVGTWREFGIARVSGGKFCSHLSKCDCCCRCSLVLSRKGHFTFTDCPKLDSNTAPAQTGNRSQLQQQASIPSVPCVCFLPGCLSSSRSPRQHPKPSISTMPRVSRTPPRWSSSTVSSGTSSPKHANPRPETRHDPFLASASSAGPPRSNPKEKPQGWPTGYQKRRRRDRPSLGHNRDAIDDLTEKFQLVMKAAERGGTTRGANYTRKHSR